MLIGAVLASLAFGVLVAYGVCLAFFTLARVHSTAAARHREIATAQPSPSIAA